MTGAEHYSLAEEFAKKARDRIEQGDTEGALACAAIAQVHAALVDVSDSRRGRPQGAVQQHPPGLEGRPRGPIKSIGRHKHEPGQ